MCSCVTSETSLALLQIEVFCITNLINCMLEADEEFIVMDFHFVVGDGGMQSLFELLHEFLRKPMWDEAALERAKQVSGLAW